MFEPFFSEPLFSKGNIQDVTNDLQEKLKAEVNQMTSDYVLGVTEADLTSYLINRYALATLVLGEEPYSIVDRHDTDVNVGWDRSRYFSHGPPVVRGIELTMALPFEGNPDLFHYGSSTGHTIHAVIDTERQELLLSTAFPHDRLEPAAIERAFNEQIQALRETLRQVKDQVDQHMAVLPGLARQHVAAARARAEKGREITGKLSFPLKLRSDSSQPIPVKRKSLAIARPSPTSVPPSHVLELQGYNEILDMLSHMSESMERSPEAFSGLSEEFLRDHFLMTLNANFGGGASGETFNVSGKTDILIRVEGRTVFVAECKFWKGAEGLRQTIDQLIGYLSWRDTKVAVVLFNRQKDFAAVLEKIPRAVAAHESYVAGVPGYAHPNRFRYRFKHNEEAGGELMLTVMAFNVPTTE